MLPHHIHDFLQRYDANTHTDEEHRQFLDWLRTAGMKDVEEVADRYQSVVAARAPQEQPSYPGLAAGIEASLDKLDQQRADNTVYDETDVRIPLYKRTWFRVAAAVLAMVSASGLYVAFRHQGQSPAVVQKGSRAPAEDVLPGSNKAVLVKSDGSEVVLEDAGNQTITEKNGQQIANKNGALSYLGEQRGSGQGHPETASPGASNEGHSNAADPGNSNKGVAAGGVAAGGVAAGGVAAGIDKIMYNTVRVPRKGQYQLVLTDGTKVWLNAESSLTYPTSFNGADRRVEVTGEAYFEVAKNARQPFHVLHDKIDVQVLGTHFNVNSYADEKEAKITLLEGSVLVSTSALAGSEVPLRPGQQARLGPSGKLRVLNETDIEEVMAWKEGRFDFRDADLKTIMRQLMRWYDVDVEYQGKIEDRFFTAELSRNKNLSAVLKILELSNIHCTIEGKTLIVRP